MELRAFVLYRQAAVHLSYRQLPVYIAARGFMPSSSLGLLLRLVHQHWTQAVEAALDEAGYGDIRPPHANVFTFARPEGIQVSELTKLARVRKQTMTQAVEELERLGYVERRPDPNDRRGRLVFLTEKGQGVRPIAMAAGRRVDESWAALTSPQQMDDLRTALRRLLEQLQ
ncbi:MarR family winged helix-turn-helix transcriptional regulator (plasmid) [Rhizobium beringeri]|uniref:MarR family winged helix-turn-helix transcriptional regulator n=1 Tax=Rhizobium beringeri TaxID=3019934 RepID=UPI002E0E5E21|nr:MarR family winged helix-turn-helix transcriptional regulator [Rhizobium beringeri]